MSDKDLRGGATGAQPVGDDVSNWPSSSCSNGGTAPAAIGHGDGLGECRHCIVACGNCPDVIRSERRMAEARAEHAVDQLTAALRALVACASHLTTLGRPDLSPIGDYGDLTECPRCEGQKYDRGSCGLCRNVGMLDANGEAIHV